MKNETARIFEDKPATRERTPLLVGVIGPSGTGKTFSALRLAAGIQRVSGGETFLIDTEARRSLHYADKFKFRHIAFGAPFSPLDYLAAIEHCVKKGAKTVIVDSMSHEHEGPGGLLEMHAAEVDRLAKGDWQKAERVKMLAWQKPKMQRRRLINTILQMECNFIFCFRAKQKLKLVKGEEPENLGFMPIAGEEFVYEMVLKCLLLPGANGVPVIASNFEGEKMMIKIPEQFRDLLTKPKQLSEDIGEELAKWAAGTAAAPAITFDELVASYAACSDAATFRKLERQRLAMWSSLGQEQKDQSRSASTTAAKRMAEAERFAETTTQGEPAAPKDREPGSDDEATQTKSIPSTAAPKEARIPKPDFAKDADAWRAHLAAFGVKEAALEWNRFSASFKRAGAGVYDERRDEVLSRMCDLVPNEQPEAVLAKALKS